MKYVSLTCSFKKSFYSNPSCSKPITSSDILFSIKMITNILVQLHCPKVFFTITAKSWLGLCLMFYNNILGNSYTDERMRTI